MSVTFSTGFHVIKPGLRISGDEISVVFVNTYDSGLYAGKKYIHIDLTNETDLTFVEAGVNGPLETIADVDALYTQLKDAGMTEAFEGFLIDPSDLSSIHIAAQQISFDFAGHQPYVFSRNPDAAVTERTKVANQTWSLPQGAFAAAATLFSTIESPEELEFQSIEDRLNLEAGQLDDLIATGMWLFPDQASFPPAADNHGRVVHSHADGAMFYAHAGAWNQLEGQAASTAADAALSGRLDVLEVDPTTATALAAGDAATLSSATTYTDTAITNVIGSAPGILDTLGEIADSINDDGNLYTTLVASIATVQADVDGNETASDAADAALSGRIDTLEADPTTATAVATVQADVDANQTASESADTALSGRLDTLEADPTTATAVAAVQSDVDQNEVDSDAAIAAEAATRENADTALSGRLDVLEVNPTTQALLDAETTDRTEGDLNAIGQSNAYTDGLLNQYFGGASSEVKADSYNAVIEAGFIPTVDATGDQFKFNDADVASVTAIAVNHDSTAGRINWFEVFPTGSVMRVTRASDSAVFDFTVTQAGVGGTNERTKNFTVTTSSTGTLVNGDTLSISTLAGPDIATGADLTVGGDLTVSGTGVTTIAGQLTLGDGLYNGRLDTYEVRANIISRFGGTRSSGTPDPDSRVDFSNPTYLWLQTSNTAFPSADDEYVTVELKRGYLKAKKDANGLIFMDLGTSADPWKDLYLSGDVNCASINTTGSFSVGDVGSFSSPALPDGVSFANLMEAIGDALVARATTAAPDFTGQVDIDTNARIEFADNLTKIHNVLRGTSINIGNNIELKPAAAGGRVEITGDLIIDASDFTDAADDTAAAAAGVVVGQVYRNGSQLMVRVS